MGRSRHDSDEDEQQPELPPPAADPPIELRYVSTPAHSQLQWRQPGGEWQDVPYVSLTNTGAPLIEGESQDVSGQAQIAAKNEDKEG